MEISVVDNPAEGRYEIRVDGALAGVAEYRDRGGRRIFVHTVIDDAFAGRGLGNRLASGALDDAITRGMKIVPRCPFIRAYLARHPEIRSRIDSGSGAA